MTNQIDNCIIFSWFRSDTIPNFKIEGIKTQMNYVATVAIFLIFKWYFANCLHKSILEGGNAVHSC